jgi:hypothetical protein
MDGRARVGNFLVRWRGGVLYRGGEGWLLGWLGVEAEGRGGEHETVWWWCWWCAAAAAVLGFVG